MKRLMIDALLCLNAMAFLPATALGGTPQGSAFNFQGQLRQDGVPLNGTIALSFTLFAVIGSQASDPHMLDLVLAD